MNRYAKSLLVCVLSIWLSGCAMQTVYDIGPDKSIGSLGGISLQINDNRPPEEKEKSYGSLLVSSSKYGIWTLGDESFKPAPSEVLRQRVLESAAKMPIKPKSIKIDVQHLVIQDNQQAHHLRTGSNSLGPLGIAIAETFHGKKFEMDHNKTLPFVSAFFQAQVEIDGISKNTTLTKTNNYRNPMSPEDRSAATRKTVDEFFAELGTILFSN